MIKDEYKISFEKIKQAYLLQQDENIDLWMILSRNGTDPSLGLITGIKTVDQCGIFLLKKGEILALVSKNEEDLFKDSGLFDEIITYDTDFKKELTNILENLNPNKIALNISLEDHLCDGMAMGQYMLLEECIGEDKLQKMEVSSEKILNKLRSKKSDTEIERIRKAVKITNCIYDEVFKEIKAGMSEIEVGNIFIEKMKKYEVRNGISFDYEPPIVCIVRAGLSHRKPGKTVIIPGDILIMDFSVDYKGYVSDIARTAYFLKEDEDKAPKDINHAFITARDAITAVIDYIAPGKKGFEVDAVGRKAIEDGGYPTIRHSTGHQIGRACHDGGTRLGPKREVLTKDVLAEVEVLEIYAIEPTVIQDNGLPCMLVEENVLILESGAEILSERQMDLILID